MLTTVLMILASVVVPMFRSTDAHKLSWAATQIESDIVFAQAESFVHADSPRLVIFNTAANRYSVVPEADPLTPLTHPVSGKPHAVTFGQGDFTHLSGVSIQSYALGGDDRLGFGLYGQLDQATDASVVLVAGEPSAKLTITIDSSTGRISTQ